MTITAFTSAPLPLAWIVVGRSEMPRSLPPVPTRCADTAEPLPASMFRSMPASVYQPLAFAK
ncbi:hypothetical protein D3C84_959870 [compost metagenome]